MATTEQLRADIDAGRTREKVAHTDPAAAPLGSDEEAAGTPVSRHAAEIARAREVDAPPASRVDGSVGFFLMVIVLIGVVLGAAGFMLVR